MTKPINQMSVEELGQLFPIIISEPDADWTNLFQIEKANIEAALGRQSIISIEHIGSTAVPGLKAKPTIDILMEVPGTIDKDQVVEKFIRMDYHYIPQPENPAPHMMFAKGYSLSGFTGQAFHIHVRYSGDWDEIYFRDYLRAHPEIALEYGRLKIKLAEVYKNDREEYTNQKGEFIKRITEKAKHAFK